MPVHFAHDLGDVVGVDVLAQEDGGLASVSSRESASASLRSSSGISPWRSSAARW